MSSTQPWLTKPEFVPFVQPIPSILYGRNIIYATRYQPGNEDKSGIFEYDPITSTHSTLKLWADCNYFPRWHLMVYSPIRDTAIIVGGGNVNDNLKLYDQIALLKMKNKTIINGYVNEYQKLYQHNLIILRKISLIILQYYRNSSHTKFSSHELKIDGSEDENPGFTVGANAKLLLTHNDNYLHIIGGTTNDYHLLYDLNTHKCIKIHSFNTQIAEAGMFYINHMKSIVMFGGFCYANRVREDQKFYDHFWCFDLNPKLALLSMDLLPIYVIHGFVREILNECEYEVVLRFDIAINDMIAEYIGNDYMEWTQWRCIEEYKMPLQMHGYGSLLYDDRIIVVFGGKIAGNLDIEDIFYLDLEDMNGWKKCEHAKMAKPGSCNAVVLDESVHILPYSSFNDHFVINIRELLPASLIK